MERKTLRFARLTGTLLSACLTVAVAGGAGAIPICGADCNEDGLVRVNELVTVVGALLDGGPLLRCSAADMNENGEFAINEVVIGVRNALIGCPSARVDDLVGNLIGEDTPGMAVMVIDRGQVLHQRGYGLANLESDTPVTPSTRFYVASMTKTFTGLSILMLAERGMLDLDDPVSLYLPELARFSDGVTIRRLLSHTSGLPDYFINDPEIYARWAGLEPAIVTEAFALLPPSTNPDPARFNALVGDGDVLTSLGLAAVLEDYGELVFAPGDAASYSNTGYDLLGGVIERVSGQSYAAFVRDNIFVPVGMSHSFLLPGTAELMSADVAKGYARVGDGFAPYVFPPQEGTGSGDIFTTLGDLLLYDQALYGETLISQATLQAAFQPQKLNDGTDATDPFGRIGLGWLLTETGGERVVFHPGGYVGFLSTLIRFVDRGLTFIVLSNREDQQIENIVLVFQLADIYLHPPGTDR